MAMKVQGGRMVPAQSVRLVDRQALFDATAAQSAISKVARALANNQQYSPEFQKALKNANQAYALMSDVHKFLEKQSQFEGIRS